MQYPDRGKPSPLLYPVASAYSSDLSCPIHVLFKCFKDIPEAPREPMGRQRERKGAVPLSYLRASRSNIRDAHTGEKCIPQPSLHQRTSISSTRPSQVGASGQIKSRLIILKLKNPLCMTFQYIFFILHFICLF